ncbi:MAG: hypothetical protein EXS10_06465 [Phycisphaerales bacterium]|nr:hypothetical protein [Phycisphaerales bacterium]
MAKAYTPGLKVSSNTTLRVRRILPVAGEVLVALGDRVHAQQPIARAMLDGDITPVHVANGLGLNAVEVAGALVVAKGDRVEKGQIIARSKGIFGFGKKEFASPESGTIESISSTTGQLMVRGAAMPVEVLAFVDGVVIAVHEREGVTVQCDAALVQGIFGIGGEAFGNIRFAGTHAAEVLDAEAINAECKGAILVGGGRVTAAAVARAREVGVSAIIAGGIDDADLKSILGYDLGVAITGSEKIGLTIVITEGFGDIAMATRTFELLRSLEGRTASVNGATQIRAGVMRPEIVVARGVGELASVSTNEVTREVGSLEIGTSVRLIRDPNFGRIGSVEALPTEPAILGSGSKARVVRVRLDGGVSVVVPRANVELIET